tara:strand:- start:118 stop:507 length:390 start_codon:yes stop_codon:yes gene_type:complete
MMGRSILTIFINSEAPKTDAASRKPGFIDCRTGRILLITNGYAIRECAITSKTHDALKSIGERLNEMRNPYPRTTADAPSGSINKESNRPVFFPFPPRKIADIVPMIRDITIVITPNLIEFQIITIGDR